MELLLPAQAEISPSPNTPVMQKLETGEPDFSKLGMATRVRMLLVINLSDSAQFQPSRADML